jgi:selT/selW/selH-like putative selenoprotein
LAASLKSRFGENTAISPGKSGQFDVLVDGELIFSKAQTGRFPVDGEVEDRFAALKGGKELPALPAAKPGVVGKILGKLTGKLGG